VVDRRRVHDRTRHLAAGQRSGDIDVMALRQDQFAAHQALRGWGWWAAEQPGALRPWRPPKSLPV
jgi:hypothetical protein